jgi:glycosyltransferase involved in cell wall biosynthesis
LHAAHACEAGRVSPAPEALYLPQPFISIVIPTFNRRDDLLAALVSVQRQDLRDFECLVVDNGPSTDGSREAVTAFASSDPRFRLVKAGPIGIFPSVNAGFRESSGDVVLVMDDDVELVSPGTLSYLVEQFEADFALGVLGLSEYYPDEKHKGHEEPPARRRFDALKDTRLYPPGMVSRWGMLGTKFHQLPFGKSLHVQHVRSSAMAVRRRAFAIVGGFCDAYTVKGHGYRCETDFCLQVKRAGYGVKFSARDPQVLHKQSPRVDGTARDGIDREYLISTGCNNAFFFLRNFWSLRSAPIFLAWDMLVGNSSQPGILRLLKAGHWQLSTHRHALTGKWLGFKMFWRYSRADTR